ncbi:Flp pilus assembly protein CpaB [Cellulomonas sp. URHB0016]
MNSRQRRGGLLLIITALGAIAVFLAVVVYVGGVSSRVGPMTQVLRLTQDVNAFQPVEPDMFESVSVPQRWLPAHPLQDVSQTEGLVAATKLPSGSTMQDGMLVQRPGVQPGYREVAIVVDAETGVAGKVSPGNHVDIIATTAGTDGVAQRSEIWVSNALVLEVGLPEDVQKSDSAGNFQGGSGVPVTFALTSEDALRLAYAESFSVKLRLALRGDGDDQVLPNDDRVFQVG